MDDDDLALRNLTYAHFVDLGRAPTAAEVAAAVSWLAGRSPGATISAGNLSDLAHAWWDDGLSPHWRPHTREDNQAILDQLDLSGQFWRQPERGLGSGRRRAKGHAQPPAGAVGLGHADVGCHPGPAQRAPVHRPADRPRRP